MYLEDKELLMLEKLGFTVKDGKITDIKEHKVAFEDLEYAGFNVYVAPDNRVFEKVGEELVEIVTPELEAERRFVAKNLN